MEQAEESTLAARIASSLGELLGARCQIAGDSSIRCYRGGIRIAAALSSAADDVEERMAEMLEKGLADLALLVRPLGGPSGELRFSARLRTSGGPGEILEGVELETLASAIERAIEDLVSGSEVGGELERVRRAVERFVEVATRGGVPGIPRSRLVGALGGPYGSGASESEVVLVQEALALFLSAVLYERSRKSLGLPPLDSYLESLGALRGLERALSNLLETRREPLVELALEALRSLPPELEGPVRSLAGVALDVAGRPHLLLRDVAGRIYHRVAGDVALKKGLATFYTEVPAAYLLADLALRRALNTGAGAGASRETAGGLARRVAELKIADFACGSGTLLAATLYCASRIAKAACFLSGVECPGVEKTLVERGLYGLEAMEYAAAVARAGLAIMSPEVAAGVGVYAVRLGSGPGGRASLGSLELLEVETLGSSVWVETVGGKVEIPGSYDVVIMNPPFTRPTGRTRERFGEAGRGFFGFVADPRIRETLVAKYRRIRERVRRDMLEVARRLFSSEPTLSRALARLSSYETARSRGLGQYFSVGQAGEGLLFLYLAYRYVKPGGVVAFVLPRNLLSGVSWFLARALLAEGFHLRYVIVSSDSESGYNFSENTSLSECLVVAERVSEHDPSEETLFVDLLKKPGSVLGSLLLSEALAAGAVELPRSAKCLVRRVRRVELLENLDNLNRFVALPEPGVVDAGLRLLRLGDLGVAGLRVPLARLGDLIASIGIDSPQFHEHFRPTRARTPYPILFGGGEPARSGILVRPNAYAEPKTQRAAEIYRRFSGRVVVPDRIWMDTAHVISAYSETPVVSNVFYIARLREPSERLEKALVYWLNTTWGVLAVLMNREETRGRWVRLKKAQWRLLPVPDFGRLGRDAVARLAELFDEISRFEPRRIPDQYSEDPRDADPLRLEIDLGLLRALNTSVDAGEAEGQLRTLYKGMAVALRRWIGRSTP